MSNKVIPLNSTTVIFGASYQNSIPNNTPVPPPRQYHSSYTELNIRNTGVPALVDANPISRYNFMIQLYNYDMNRIGDIELMGVCLPCAFSRMYDAFIYFYQYLILALTCGLAQKRGFLFTLIMLAIYFFLLCGPIISIITFVLTCCFILYYIAGVIIRVKNSIRLGQHRITEKMIHSSVGPPINSNKVNGIFEVQSTVVQEYFRIHNPSIYVGIIQRNVSQFMVYTNELIEDYYDYITSGRMICFHVTGLLLAIAGLIGSINIFPEIYGYIPIPTTAP